MDAGLQAVLTCIGGIITGVAGSYFGFRGKRSTYEATVFGAAERIVARLESQVVALEAKNAQLERSLIDAETMIRHLNTTIEKLALELRQFRDG